MDFEASGLSATNLRIPLSHRKAYVMLEKTSTSGFKDSKEKLFWHVEMLLEHTNANC